MIADIHIGLLIFNWITDVHIRLLAYISDAEPHFHITIYHNLSFFYSSIGVERATAMSATGITTNVLGYAGTDLDELNQYVFEESLIPDSVEGR